MSGRLWVGSGGERVRRACCGVGGRGVRAVAGGRCLKRGSDEESDNQHVVGGGVWQGAGVGGSMAFAMAPVGNDVPHASRSAIAAFFARMDVVVRWLGGSCSDDGGDDDGDDIVALVATRAGIGRRGESGGGNVFAQGAGGGRRDKRGGRTMRGVVVATESMTTTGEIFPRPPPPARR